MTSPPAWERALGMEAYASECPPCHGVAKSSDEDFMVEEAVDVQGVTPEPLPGYFPLFRVEKRSIDTLHLEKELTMALGSKVTFGGLKDKRALAVQYVTATGRSPRRVSSLEGRNFRATLVGYVPKPMSRGSVLGNRFRVTLRQCCSTVESNVSEVLGLAERRLLPNFFGHQRFGGPGARTSDIGKAIVLEDFEEAVRVMLCEPRENDDEGAAAARAALSEGRYEEGMRLLPERQDTERLVARSLAKDPSDHVRALRHVPLKLRRLFVHAYQSLVFNRTLSLAMGRGMDISRYEPGDNWCELMENGLTLSLVHGVREPAPSRAEPMVQIAGFAYRNYGSRFDPLVTESLAVDGISPSDFYVKGMQEVSAEGGFRVPHLLVADSASEFKEGSAILDFSLARGQYATVLLREILKPGEPSELGVL